MEKIFKHLSEHKPIIINYGKGIIKPDEDVKEECYYDESIQKYKGELGVWSNKLLREIARGEVEDITIEIPD